jgi:hypothetical protein
MAKKNDDDQDGWSRSKSVRQAKVAALVLAVAGGAWTFRDYLSGKISGRNEQTPITTPSIEPPPRDEPPQTLAVPNETKDKWQKRTSRADRTPNGRESP